LCDAQSMGGCGEAARFDNAYEVPQLANVHFANL
jgi:hypothetical protein